MANEHHIFAPFTSEQVERLNAWQRDGRVHPFTCGGDRGDVAHVTYADEHGTERGELVASRDGWTCPVCGYRQNWAHAMMAEPIPEWFPPHP